MNRFRDLMREANCKDVARATEIAKKAIMLGDDPDDVAAQIRRSQPSLFYSKGRK